MAWVTGPNAFVGVTSVSPVTRGATNPMTTAKGTERMPAQIGILKRNAIKVTTIGANIPNPTGNHHSGHLTSAKGSSSAGFFLENSADKPLKDLAILL